MNSIGKFVLLCSFLTLGETALRFTNINCQSLRPDFSTFPRCELKVVGRGVISLNIHVKLLNVPVNNVTVNLSLHKKSNGYQPLFNNYTFDYCKFQKNRKSYPFVKMFYDALRKVSNINHTCPYDHDLIVDNLILTESMFKFFPLPQGEYMVQNKVYAHNDLKAVVKCFVQITSELL